MLQCTNPFKPTVRVTIAKYVMVGNHDKLFYINGCSLWTECLQQLVKRKNPGLKNVYKFAILLHHHFFYQLSVRVWESGILPHFCLIKCLQLLHSPTSLLYFVCLNAPGFQLFSFSLCFITFFFQLLQNWVRTLSEMLQRVQATNVLVSDQWWVPTGCHCWRPWWGCPQ